MYTVRQKLHTGLVFFQNFVKARSILITCDTEINLQALLVGVLHYLVKHNMFQCVQTTYSAASLTS